MSREPAERLRLKVPKAWLAMADNLALITGQSRSEYIRGALIRQMMEDWQTTPGRGFWVRPKVPVYQPDRDSWVQVATTLGGERVWPIGNAGYLPASMGGALLMKADIVPVGQVSGLTMTDAYLPRDGFGGPCGK